MLDLGFSPHVAAVGFIMTLVVDGTIAAEMDCITRLRMELMFYCKATRTR